MHDWPAPAHAERMLLDLGGKRRTDQVPAIVALYRSYAYPLDADPPDALTVNLGEGWRLLRLEAPTSAKVGAQVTVTHVWRVGAPPNEPFGHWYFAPFVKLHAPDGAELVHVDDAPALLGWQWRSGDVLISAVRFTAPGNLPPGEYTLEMSLFDPNQAKNAVYFSPLAPSVPIVTIQRRITLSSS
ncbi:MAG: hypothetical protein RMM31_02280 [Anaerolineae bacterium]|nr:hypothetical protein [Thermoflexales bacterium]MDW8395049.1 hypothetical protein [Anaerolineae bacterium]